MKTFEEALYVLVPNGMTCEIQFSVKRIYTTLCTLCYNLGAKVRTHLFHAHGISEETPKNLIPPAAFERKVTWWLGNRNEGNFFIE